MPDRPVRYRGAEYPVLKRYRVGARLYLVVERVGHAGRRVYRAFDTAAKEMRALHVLDDSPGAEQQLKTLQQLTRGDNEILQILDCTRQDGQLWVVLPWIAGTTLRKVLQDIREKRQLPIAAPEAVRLAKGVAHSLAHLHRRKQLVHGDVKPANLILTHRTSLVLIDYGSAWPVQHTTARSQGDGVSPSYASPEQLQGDVRVDFRTDVFSLGVVLYELLTGELPYNGVAGRAALLPDGVDVGVGLVAASKASRDAGKLSQRVWKPIDSLLESSLALDPRDRYDTPNAWLDGWAAAVAALRQTRGANPAPNLVVRFFDWLQERFLPGD